MGKTRRPRAQGRLGVVVRGGPTRKLGWARALTKGERLFEGRVYPRKCPGSLTSCALAYVHRRVLGGPVRAHWVPAPRGGCLRVGSSILHLSQETSFLTAPSLSLWPCGIVRVTVNAAPPLPPHGLEWCSSKLLSASVGLYQVGLGHNSSATLFSPPSFPHSEASRNFSHFKPGVTSPRNLTLSS